MKPKSAILILSERVNPASKTLEKTKQILSSNKIPFQTIPINSLQKESIQNIDLIITLGGDGTLIRASHLTDSQPILGINADYLTSEGKLLTLDQNNLDQFQQILQGNFHLEKLERITASINNSPISEKALNEIYFGAKQQFHTSRYTITIDDISEEQRSSGVLIVNPTGSSAWYKSAGGEPFYEGLRFLAREPFSGRLFQPKLLTGQIKDEIKLTSDMHHDACIALDSNRIYNVKHGDTITIKKSKTPLNIVKPNDISS